MEVDDDLARLTLVFGELHPGEPRVEIDKHHAVVESGARAELDWSKAIEGDYLELLCNDSRGFAWEGVSCDLGATARVTNALLSKLMMGEIDTLYESMANGVAEGPEVDMTKATMEMEKR